MMVKYLTVLTATYNGAEFLDEFLSSVVSQTVPADIVVRDDASRDGSPEIVRGYCDNVSLMEDGLGNVGVLENFNILMQSTDATYTAFADQDDIWVKDKLEVELDMMHKMEECYGSQTPILVHSDLTVSDAKGRIIKPSLWRHQGLNPQIKDFSRLLIQNNVTGCTVLINRALKELAFPVPKEAVMHDWWLALVAAAAGKIGFVPRPLVRYRQHGGNQLGAVPGNAWSALRRLRHMDPRDSLRAAQRQAGAFYTRFKGHEEMKGVVRVAREYSAIREYGYIERLCILYRNSFWKQDLTRNVGLVFFI